MKRLKALGAHIRTLRRQQNISQAQLAFETNLSRLQIVRIEKGTINCGVTSLFDISEVLGVEAKDLLDFRMPRSK
jgi:transcriptional regulator with XRE-family HTH domain